MPDVTQKTVKLLRDELANQHRRIETSDAKLAALTVRFSQLIDEKLLLEKQLSSLQETVAQDMKYLYERLT